MRALGAALVALCVACAGDISAQALADGAAAGANDAALNDALDSAFADYAQRAIATLSASESARERWVAGLMLLGDSTRASGDMEQALSLRNRAHQLFDAALRDGAADPVLLMWAALDPPTRDEMDSTALVTARLKMIQQLQQLEPANAVVWVAGLPSRQAPGSIPEAIELLHKAARAEHFDTHFSDSMKMLIAAYGKVAAPDPWPDTTTSTAWAHTGPTDLPVIMAVGVASALAMPYLAELSSWCTDADEQPWHADCLALARVMVDSSDAIVARSLGVSLLGSLAVADSADAKRASSLRRQMAWEVEMGLQHVGPGQPVTFATWRTAWDAENANELSVARYLLQAQGLAVDAPADYVPAWDR